MKIKQPQELIQLLKLKKIFKKNNITTFSNNDLKILIQENYDLRNIANELASHHTSTISAIYLFLKDYEEQTYVKKHSILFEENIQVGQTIKLKPFYYNINKQTVLFITTSCQLVTINLFLFSEQNKKRMIGRDEWFDYTLPEFHLSKNKCHVFIRT